MGVCGADLTQLALSGLQAGPALGGALYALLALGVARRVSLAHHVLVGVLVVPIGALTLGLLGGPHITTSWTIPILGLQLLAAVLALRSLLGPPS